MYSIRHWGKKVKFFFVFFSFFLKIKMGKIPPGEGKDFLGLLVGRGKFFVVFVDT